jgi:hypothetical protein
MTYLDRLANLPDADFIQWWNGAATIDDIVEQVVARVGRVPRWAVVARAVALRKAGCEVKSLDPAPTRPVSGPSSPSPASVPAA